MNEMAQSEYVDQECNRAEWNPRDEVKVRQGKTASSRETKKEQ